MANTIKHKRGSGSNPGTSDLSVGELAIRTDTAKLFTKNDAGSVVQIGSGINDLVEDTSPQLGGDLQSNGNDIDFADNDKAIFGTGGDLEIYHDGNKSFIQDSGTGSLRIISNDFRIYNAANNEFMARFQENGATELYHDNSKKFETTSTGVQITGNINVPSANSVTAGSVNTTGSTALTAVDNGTAFFGTDLDLRIFHSGSHSQIIHNGTGNLFLDSIGGSVNLRAGNNAGGVHNSVVCNLNAGVELYYDNTKRFETLSSGAVVTGSLGIGTTSPSANLEINKGSEGTYLKVGGDNASNGRALTFTSSTSSSNGALHTIDATSSGGVIALATSGSEKLRVDSSGRVGISTSSPDTLLHLAGGSPNIKLHNTGSSASANDVLGAILFQHADADDPGITAKIQCVAEDNVGNSFLAFYNGDGGNADERVRIDSSGRLLVGRTSGDFKLDVDGAARLSGFLYLANAQRIVWGSSDSAFIEGDDAAYLRFGVNNEAMRIDNSGRVGIGITSMSRQLEVNSNTANTFIRIKSSDTGNAGLEFGDQSDSVQAALFFDSSDNSLKFNGFNNSERARITSGGKFFIAHDDRNSVDTSTSNLSVFGNTDSSTGNVPASFFSGDSAQTRFLCSFFNGNGNVGSIAAVGSSTQFNTSSDYRLKENTTPITDGLTRIKLLKPYKFNFIANPSETLDGFLAHEVAEVLPQAVTGKKDGMKGETFYEEGDELPEGKQYGEVKTYSTTEIEIQQLDHTKLIPLLTAALKEEIDKREQLESRVAALEAS